MSEFRCVMHDRAHWKLEVDRETELGKEASQNATSRGSIHQGGAPLSRSGRVSGPNFQWSIICFVKVGERLRQRESVPRQKRHLNASGRVTSGTKYFHPRNPAGTVEYRAEFVALDKQLIDCT